MNRLVVMTFGIVAIATPLAAQQRTLSQFVRQYVSVDAPVVALTHARVVDGTGTPAKDDQTVVIRGEKVTAVGKTGSVDIPPGAQVMDLTGKTVIPGIIGLHDHMYYGGMRFMGASYPRLFLSAGVTTIRTTGSVDSYQELNLKRAIDSLLIPGPGIVVTGPYLQGPGPGPGAMHPLDAWCATGPRRA
jgi:imidazolonepropionase-like amidohydrolase